MNKSYGERMKELRDAAGFSQKDMAESLGISQAALSDLERSTNPPLKRVDQLCEILGKETWEFFITHEDLSKKIKLPTEYIMLAREIMELDEESREDLLELMLFSLQKYKSALSRHVKTSKA